VKLVQLVGFITKKSNSTFLKVTYNILARKDNLFEVGFLLIEARD